MSILPFTASPLIRETPVLWVVSGAAYGFACYFILRLLPASWLTAADDQGQMSPIPRFCFWPDATGLIIYGMVFALLAQTSLDLNTGLSHAWLPVWGWTGAVCAWIAVVDARTRLIPDQLVIALLPSLPLLLFISTRGTGATLAEIARAAALRLASGVVAALVLLAISLIFSRLLHQDSIGMGDIKLIAVAGALTGFRYLTELFLIGFLLAGLGAVAILLVRILEHRSKLPDLIPKKDTRTNKPPSSSTDHRLPDSPPVWHSEMALGPYLVGSLLLLLLFGAQIKGFLWLN